MRPEESAQVYRFEGIVIDPAIASVVVDGNVVVLTSMEFALLVLFATHAGKTLARHQILKSVRDIDVTIVTRSVDVLVSRLRQKLGDSGRSPRFIATVWGVGYCFIAEDR